MDAKQTISHLKSKLKAAKPSAEVLYIGPEVAEWLLEQKWKENRPLQQATVDKYVHILKHGGFGLTGQGIILSSSGRLIDGQHRLWAIFDSGIGADMLVVFGIEEEQARNIDCGSTRSLAFRAGLSNSKTAALNFILKLAFGAAESNQMSVRALEQVYGPSVDALLALQSRKTPMLRQAAIVSAATLWHCAGYAGYVEDVYSSLLGLDAGSLPPIGKSFLRQCVESSQGRRRTGGMDLFVRAFRAFDPQASQLTRLQYKDGIPSLDQARAMITKAVANAGVTFDARRVETQKGLSRKAVIKAGPRRNKAKVAS